MFVGIHIENFDYRNDEHMESLEELTIVINQTLQKQEFDYEIKID